MINSHSLSFAFVFRSDLQLSRRTVMRIFMTKSVMIIEYTLLTDPEHVGLAEDRAVDHRGGPGDRKS